MREITVQKLGYTEREVRIGMTFDLQKICNGVAVLRGHKEIFKDDVDMAMKLHQLFRLQEESSKIGQFYTRLKEGIEPIFHFADTQDWMSREYHLKELLKLKDEVHKYLEDWGEISQILKKVLMTTEILIIDLLPTQRVDSFRNQFNRASLSKKDSALHSR